MNEELLKTIYENEGFQDKSSFDDFKNDIQDEELQKAIWTNAGFDSKVSFEEFQKDLGVNNSVSRLDYTKAVINEGTLRGKLSSKLSTGMFSDSESYENMDEEELSELSSLFTEMEENAKVLASETGSENDGYIMESLEKMGGLGSEVAKSLIGSFVNMYDNPGQTLAAGAAGAGAAAAAAGPIATGLAATGFGIPVAAILEGASAGIGATSAIFAIAGGDVEGSMEAYGRFQEYAQEKGLDLKNPQDLKRIFTDAKFMDDTLVAANLKGSVTGGLEAVGGMFIPGVAGKVAGTAAKKVGTSKVAGYATGTVLGEGLLGGTSDVAGSVAGNIALGEDLNFDELAESFGQEFAVEMFTGGLAQGTGMVIDHTVFRKANKAQDEIINAAMIGDRDGFVQSVSENIENGVIDKKAGEAIVENYDKVSSALQQVPDTEITNKKDRRELVKNLIEKQKLSEKQLELQSQINNAATPAISKKIESKKKKIDNLLKHVDSKIEYLADVSINGTSNENIDASGSVATKPDVASTEGVSRDTPSSIDIEIKNELFGEEISSSEKVAKDTPTQSTEAKKAEIERLENDKKALLDRKEKLENSKDESLDELAGINDNRTNRQKQIEDIDFSIKSIDTQLNQKQPTPSTETDNTTLTDFDMSSDRSSMVGQRVDYGGIEGTVVETEAGYGVETEDGSIVNIESASSDTSNLDLGISLLPQVEAPQTTQPDPDPETLSYNEETDTLTAYGNNYSVIKPRYDESGNVSSVTVKDDKGVVKTIRNKKVLETLPAQVRSVDSESLVQVTETASDGFTPTDQAEFEILSNREQVNEAETLLDSYAELIGEEVRTNPEFAEISNSFTDPFDDGTARDRGLTGPIGRKANASLVAKAILDSKGAALKKVKQIIGNDVFNEAKTAAKAWREASKRNTPTTVRKARAEALAQERANKIELALDRLYPGYIERKADILNKVETLVKSIPGVTIKVYNTPEAFAEATGADSTLGGVYGTFNDTIYINVAYADGKTVAHEAVHAVFTKLFGQGSKDALLFHEAIMDVLRKGTREERQLAKRLKKHIEMYDDSDLTRTDKLTGINLRDLRAEEFFAELLGELIQNGQKIKKPRVKKILQAINEIVKKYTGLTIFDGVSDVRDLIDFTNALAGGMGKGLDLDTIMSEKAGPVLRDVRPVSSHNFTRMSKAPAIDLQNSKYAGVNSVDISQLLDDFKAENGREARVWVWQSDWLNRGTYYNPESNVTHELQGGIGYALDPVNIRNGSVWASNNRNPGKAGRGKYEGRVEKADFVLMTMMSPNTSMDFSKGTSDILVKEAIAATGFSDKQLYNRLKKLAKKAGKTDLLGILSNVNSFDSLLSNTGANRKILVKSVHSGLTNISKTRNAFHYELHNDLGFMQRSKLVASIVDPFLVDNGFKLGDIALVLKIDSIENGTANHDSYSDDFKGSVIGIPNKKYSIFDVLPESFYYSKSNVKIDVDFKKYQKVMPYGLGTVLEQSEFRFSKAKPETKGEKFRDFFTAVSQGNRDKSDVDYKPLYDLTGRDGFINEYLKHVGNFDDHIAKSIPGYSDLQIMTGHYLANKLNPDNKVLDLGASEGSWVKTISNLSKAKSIALDTNTAMQNKFNETPSKYSKFEKKAFLEGYVDDKTGEVIEKFESDEKFDVVHEGMLFQFLSGDRAAQFKEAASFVKDTGILMVEEKIAPDGNVDPAWDRREARKDEYKAQYFDSKTLATKKKEVLGNSKKGMTSRMVTDNALIEELGNHFEYIGRYWNSSNFVGYVASNTRSEVVEFLDNIGANTVSDYTFFEPGMVKGEYRKSKIAEDALPYLTDDGQGNYVFFHYNQSQLESIDPKHFGKNTITSSQEQSDLTGAPHSFYYTVPDFAEQGVGTVQHQVKIPKEKVYDITKDFDGFYDEARVRFKKHRGERMAFGPNAQLAWVSKVAMENGYEMGIARWGRNPTKGNYLRAQTPLTMTPVASNSQYTSSYNSSNNGSVDLGQKGINEAKAKIHKYVTETHSYKDKPDLFNFIDNLSEASKESISEFLANRNKGDIPTDIVNEYYESVYRASQYRKQKTQRNTVLDRVKNKIDKLKKIYKKPEVIYSKFRQEFIDAGVTLGDIQRLFLGLDPNMNVEAYAVQAQETRDRAISTMEQAGLTPVQIEANMVVFEEIAAKWAKDTGRTADEFFVDIIEDFRLASAETLQNESDILFEAENVKKSILQKLIDILPFTKSRKYQNEAKGKSDINTTPLQQDKDLESDLDGQQFLNQNKQLIRGARKITTDGKAIIYLTTDARVSTPVHELAHVYEMYMSSDDRNTVLEWLGHDQWTTSSSEMFAKGFEQFLREGRKTDNSTLQVVFNNFSNWLKGIYNGVMRYAGRPIHLSPEMRELYANMFYSELKTLEEYGNSADAMVRFYNNLKPTTKFKKAEYERIIENNFDSPTVAYENTTIARIVSNVVNRGLNKPETALGIAMEARIRIQRDKDVGGNGDPQLTIEEAVGMADAILQLQSMTNELQSRLDNARRNGGNTAAYETELETLRNDVVELSSIMSLYRSSAGLALGIGSKLFNAADFSKGRMEVEIDRLNATRDQKGLRKLNDKEKKQIYDAGKRLRDLTGELKRLRSKESEGAKKHRAQIVNNHLKDLFKIPMFKAILNDLKTFTPQQIKDKNQSNIDLLNKYYQENSQTLFDSDQTFDPELALFEVIAGLVKSNPNLNDVTKLTAELVKTIPSMTENKVVDSILSVTDNRNTVVNRNRSAISLLKEESKMVDKLSKLLEGALKYQIKPPTPEERSNNIEALDSAIKAIEQLVAQGSYLSSDTDFTTAIGHLNTLQSMYNDLMIGGKNPGDITEADVRFMASVLDKFKQTRMRVTYEEKLNELKEDIDKINSIYKTGGNSNELKGFFLDLSRKYDIGSTNHKAYIDPEVAQLRQKILKEKRDLYDLINRRTESGLHTMFKETVNTPRTLILAADYSFIFYQGGLLTVKNMATNPVQTLTNIKNSLVSSFSQTKYDEVVTDLTSDPDYYEAYIAGLHLSSLDNSSLEEELNIKSVLERVPFGLGRSIKAVREFSERGYTSYMNALRLQEYKKLTQGITDPVALETIAEHINTSTGAAKRFGFTDSQDKAINSMLQSAAIPFIAPRLYASVFKSMYEMVLVPDLVKMATSKNPENRQAYRRKLTNNMKILTSQAMVMGSMYALTSIFGEEGDDEDMLNVFKSNFLKSKFGQTVVSLSPFASYIRFVGRYGAKMAEWAMDESFNDNRTWQKKTPLDIFWTDFIRNRFNPIVTSSRALWSNRDYRGVAISEEDQIPKRWIGSIAPISIQGVAQNVSDSAGWDKIGAEFIVDMFGFNSYTVTPFRGNIVQNYLAKTNFTFRMNYPNSMGKNDTITRSRYKKKVEDDFATRLENLLSEGKKPTKAYLKKLKKSVEQDIAKDFE